MRILLPTLFLVFYRSGVCVGRGVLEVNEEARRFGD
jgi:hypothetical protein